MWRSGVLAQVLAVVALLDRLACLSRLLRLLFRSDVDFWVFNFDLHVILPQARSLGTLRFIPQKLPSVNLPTSLVQLSGGGFGSRKWRTCGLLRA